jgi:photosystem II stability/assembly factor-like uncharacterized protein
MFIRFGLLLLLFSTLVGSAQVWQPVPLRTSKIKAVGMGGEGCQWPLALAADPVDGTTLFLGTDVGGVYRSIDGGLNWAPANLGLNARGANAFAFDPGNIDRVLLLACNSVARPEHGLYLSTDRGQTWKQVQPLKVLGYRDVREQIAFDPSSFDAATRKTRIVYWSTEQTKESSGALYKSSDGGETWSVVPTTVPLGGCILKVNPVKGWVYAGGANGLFLSKDQGATFDKIAEGPVRGLDVIASQPDAVCFCTKDKIQTSSDDGAHFEDVGNPLASGESSPGGLCFLKVSPADPQHMLINVDQGRWNFKRYFTLDHGTTWKACTFDVKLSFIPNNNKMGMFQWSPKDPDLAWSIGGDFVTRSTDAGATWKWSNNGYTGVMVGRSFTFNTHNPDLLALPSQDYDVAMTADGGDTWKHLRFSGYGWGGFTYGAYAVSPDLIYAGNRTSWGGPTELRITRDGGATYDKSKLFIKGEAIGFGDPTDDKVLFFGNYRSEDGGTTWKPMDGCEGVFTFNPAKPEELFGGNEKAVVLSTDKGLTWKTVASLPSRSVKDIACDPKHNLLYVTTNGQLYTIDRISAMATEITDRLVTDQMGQRGAVSVAVDPVNPDIVYVCRAGNAYLSNSSCQRSVDGGKIWQVLTRNLSSSAVTSGPDGGHEAEWVRVNPKTREAWFGTNCFGVWKIGPPTATD